MLAFTVTVVGVSDKAVIAPIRQLDALTLMALPLRSPYPSQPQRTDYGPAIAGPPRTVGPRTHATLSDPPRAYDIPDEAVPLATGQSARVLLLGSKAEVDRVLEECRQESAVGGGPAKHLLIQ